LIAAIVPAAGESQRMGRPKLILTIGGQTVIARVVSALREAGADPVIVVSPPPDAEEASRLRQEAADAGAAVVVPATRPPDMRSSFERALAYLEDLTHFPTTVLLTPADSPCLTRSLVARVIDHSRRDPSSIIIPTFEGRRGHPVALPLALARQVRDLPAGVGINALVARHGPAVIELPVDDPAVVEDLDTPEDYARLVEPSG
jgi:molybdenum cofactor cytidylyltransferase